MNGSFKTPAERAALLPIRWETHAARTTGARPLEAINREFVRGGDGLVGCSGICRGVPPLRMSPKPLSANRSPPTRPAALYTRRTDEARLGNSRQ
jgi:hypothetical protein